MVSREIPKAAWIIVLTSTNDYVKGVVTIAQALRRVRSNYPLVVLYTDAVTESAQQRLKESGCILKHIDPIRPRGKVTYFTERFTETWTKLAVWGQDEYERLVLLDADMLPLQNMDELMTLRLPDSDHVAACHACTCNPQKIKAYPSDWWVCITCSAAQTKVFNQPIRFALCRVPENCAYTRHRESKYFNSGLIVLTPSRLKFEAILTKLHSLPDLNIYKFPDQDFLNQVFQDKWQELPYIYNALKTLPKAHSNLWQMEHVKNIHYILAKPWDANPKALDADSDYGQLYKLWWNVFESTKKWYNKNVSIDFPNHSLVMRMHALFRDTTFSRHAIQDSWH